MHKILALDLGTTTGWAIWQPPHQHIISGTISLKNDRFQGGGMRFLRFRNWLDEAYGGSGFDLVYFEEVRRHIGTDAAHLYGGFLAVLSSWCEVHKVPYQGVPVGTIKHHITGRGNASKQDVIKAVKALGYHPKDDNEADAIALSDWARAQFTKINTPVENKEKEA